MTNPTWWEATVSRKFYPDLQTVIDIFEAMGADRYVIGEEIGEGGYMHFQCRIVFKKGKDLKQLVHDMPSVNWQPTSVRDFNYVEKEGKFYRSWEKVLKNYAMMEMLDWQATLVCELGQQNDREIIVVVDERGGHGKTTLAKIMQARHEAQYCPQMESASDYMAFAMAKPSKAYFIDVPRAEDYKKKKSLWSAIEQIKNGYLYDKRYNYRDMWIESPKIVVTANEYPPADCLSMDRWKVYDLVDFGGSTYLMQNYTWMNKQEVKA